ncbi:hypothetical protein THIOSC13_1690005 [uncultured Thiomicrorhabdus sp.]
MILIEIEHQAGMGRLVLILCQIEDVLDLPLSKPNDTDTDSTLYQEQERQLIKAKEQLQTVIEELETSNEEMQSMNEELQSSNEELQSSNEELETTNEELQSTNEELQTAYAELRIAYEDKDHQQTELEQLANELERTNTLLIDAESLGKTGSFRWDIPQNTMAWSQGVFKLFGLNMEKYQPTYEALVGIIYPEDRSTFEEFIENVLTMKNPQAISFRALNSEKEILWLKLEVAASFNNLKQAEYVMGTLTDVSEMAQARDEIDRQQTFTDILLNNSLGGVFIYDFKTGCNSFINPAYTKLLGYTLDDLKNLESKAFMDLFHPDDLSSVLQHIEKVNASNVGETFVIRYRIKHKSSKDYIMVHSKDTLFSTATSSKKPNAMMGIFMEISDVENGDLKITEN